MRSIRIPTVLVLAQVVLGTLSTAATFSPFLPALNPLEVILSNETIHKLHKRQDSTACPNNYDSCSNLGAASLCCVDTAVCSADYAGNVACCPTGAACTGTIGGIITAGTIAAGSSGVAASTSGAALVTTTTTAGLVETTSSGATSTSNNGLVLASTTGTTDAATSGFIIAGTSTVATLASGAGLNMQLVSVSWKGCLIDC